MDGVLIIDKEKNFTSHDVVAKVKKALGAKKVGHLGTLDPNATGVLALVINKATKYADRFSGGEKTYHAVVKLGEETDTYDSEGKITETKSIDGVSAEDVEKVLCSFLGEIDQLPPMFSAVKKDGVPLYKLARKGIEIEREAKKVEIYSIENIKVELPLVSFDVSASRGTYIRTLAFDFGRKLGVGAHLQDLRRTGSGIFKIDDSVKCTESKEVLESKVIPLGKLLMDSVKEDSVNKDKRSSVEATGDSKTESAVTL